VKAQTAASLEKAKELLGQARTMLGAGLSEAAGRTAYLAGFHAAQALIFERHDRIFKTHSAVQGEFARLVKDDPRFAPGLRVFLGRAYNLKSIADYETGPDSHISYGQAAETIVNAEKFVGALTAVLSEGA
jgi:uncharacterized protein (UPF0332 family)